MPDGGGRLLKLREGHNKPPTKIRFYGSLGTSIISAGNIFFLIYYFDNKATSMGLVDLPDLPGPSLDFPDPPNPGDTPWTLLDLLYILELPGTSGLLGPPGPL